MSKLETFLVSNMSKENQVIPHGFPRYLQFSSTNLMAMATTGMRTHSQEQRKVMQNKEPIIEAHVVLRTANKGLLFKA